LAIGPVGRIVQCARCAHRWLQTVAAAAAQAAARQAVDAAMNSPQTAPGSGAVTVDTPSASTAAPLGEPPPSSGPSLGSPRSFEEIAPVPDLVIRPPRQRNSLPAVIAPRRKSRLPALLGAGVVMIAVAAVAAAIYFFGEPILDKMPAEWRTLLHL
jgi:hypothetical protein